MKDLGKLFLILILTSSKVLAGVATESNSLQAEKCLLIRSTQDSANKYPALIGVNAINIYGEVSFMNSINSSGKSEFPLKDTIITFSFKNNSNSEARRDLLFKTIQETSFLTKSGRVIKFDQISDAPFMTAYTHTYLLKQPMRELTIKATHTVAQIIDHWASKEVLVEYSENQKTPVSTSTIKGSFLFKCNGFDSALDILK
jgi:hypothetical protein